MCMIHWTVGFYIKITVARTHEFSCLRHQWTGWAKRFAEIKTKPFIWLHARLFYAYNVGFDDKHSGIFRLGHIIRQNVHVISDTCILLTLAYYICFFDRRAIAKKYKSYLINTQTGESILGFVRKHLTNLLDPKFLQLLRFLYKIYKAYKVYKVLQFYEEENQYQRCFLNESALQLKQD